MVKQLKCHFSIHGSSGWDSSNRSQPSIRSSICSVARISLKLLHFSRDSEWEYSWRRMRWFFSHVATLSARGMKSPYSRLLDMRCWNNIIVENYGYLNNRAQSVLKKMVKKTFYSRKRKISCLICVKHNNCYSTKVTECCVFRVFSSVDEWF
jgi:hypothetical protein